MNDDKLLHQLKSVDTNIDFPTIVFALGVLFIFVFMIILPYILGAR